MSAKEAGSPRLLAYARNQPGEKLYDKVAERSGFITTQADLIAIARRWPGKPWWVRIEAGRASRRVCRHRGTTRTRSAAPTGCRRRAVRTHRSRVSRAALLGRRRRSAAIIIGGPRGIGKATLAFRLARFLLAQGRRPKPVRPGATVLARRGADNPSSTASRRAAPTS